ncbi:MAG: hypothetical protein COT15_03700 [Candidatus Diapherotrites archaeon CG08_land_8_20_14_0_20_34_12]|nr:MAG: hypothetical protein COT15_03700 [Candidatus Diapherotrites archaeon CG08_land_8_20_14_0_20_34_12]
MEVVEASISGARCGPFDHSGGHDEPYSKGAFGSGITLTIIIKGDSTDEDRIRKLRDEILGLVHHI